MPLLSPKQASANFVAFRVPTKPVFPAISTARAAPGSSSRCFAIQKEGNRDMSEFRDVYSKITDRIIADLEQGVRPWMRPWSAERPSKTWGCYGTARSS